MPRVETHHARVPWSWVAWMTTPWLALFYVDNISNGGPLTATIARFVESPVLLGFLSSLNVAFALLFGVVASYLSDRIWTPWGRRRPFLMVGWAGSAAALMVLPFTSSLASLVLAVVVLQLFASLTKPLEALYNEVIPPDQRGRAAVVRNLGQHALTLLFFGVLFAQFDTIHRFPLFGRSVEIGGHQVLYWTGSLLLLVVVVFLATCLRENRPAAAGTIAPPSTAGFFRDVFGRRQWWLLYLLYSTPILSGPSGGSFGFLMQTEQLGFSKADIGISVSIGAVVVPALFVPLAGYLTDHMSRMTLLRIGILGPAVVEFVLFLHLRYLADYSITLPTLVGYGLAGLALKTCAFLVWGPLIFDYVPTDRMGTVSAGLAFIGNLTPFVITNLAGFWVTGFTALFGATGGSRYDYSSLYVLQVGCAALAFGITVLFVREEQQGRILPLGRLEAKRAPSS